MDLLLSPDQEAMRDAVVALADRIQIPWSAVPARQEVPQLSTADWKACADMGWFGLAISGESGGVDLTAVEEIILFRELGRRLIPGPILATVLAAHAAEEQGFHGLCTALVAGERRASIATPTRTPGSFVVPDWSPGSVLLVISEGGIRLVEADVPIDATRPSLDPLVVLSLISRMPEGLDVDEPTAQALSTRGSLLIAASLVGVAQAALDSGVQYAKTRMTFGKAIGAHQALKHRCANMYMSASVADAHVAYAAVALASGLAGAPQAVAEAELLAAKAARENSASNVQIHGGMGFTWEQGAHAYVGRAEVFSRLLGGQESLASRVLPLGGPEDEVAIGAEAHQPESDGDTIVAAAGD